MYGSERRSRRNHEQPPDTVINAPASHCRNEACTLLFGKNVLIIHPLQPRSLTNRTSNAAFSYGICLPCESRRKPFARILDRAKLLRLPWRGVCGRPNQTVPFMSAAARLPIVSDAVYRVLTGAEAGHAVTVGCWCRRDLFGTFQSSRHIDSWFRVHTCFVVLQERSSQASQCRAQFCPQFLASQAQQLQLGKTALCFVPGTLSDYTDCQHSSPTAAALSQAASAKRVRPG